jgi:hypothetical protein
MNEPRCSPEPKFVAAAGSPSPPTSTVTLSPTVPDVIECQGGRPDERLADTNARMALLSEAAAKESR